jgi:hypothetical protein
MANVGSSDLLHQVRTLFGAGTVTGLSEAQLLERFTYRSTLAAGNTLAAEAADQAGLPAALDLKVAAAVMLALALAGAAAVQVGTGAGARSQAGDRDRGRALADRAHPALAQSADHRPADEIVKEVEKLLKSARHAPSEKERIRIHETIASRVDELRTAYPDGPRVARFLPERWTSLSYLDQFVEDSRMAQVRAEIGAVLKTTNNPVLRSARGTGSKPSERT